MVCNTFIKSILFVFCVSSVSMQLHGMQEENQDEHQHFRNIFNQQKKQWKKYYDFQNQQYKWAEEFWLEEKRKEVLENAEKFEFDFKKNMTQLKEVISCIEKKEK